MRSWRLAALKVVGPPCTLEMFFSSPKKSGAPKPVISLWLSSSHIRQPELFFWIGNASYISAPICKVGSGKHPWYSLNFAHLSASSSYQHFGSCSVWVPKHQTDRIVVSPRYYSIFWGFFTCVLSRLQDGPLESLYNGVNGSPTDRRGTVFSCFHPYKWALLTGFCAQLVPTTDLLLSKSHVFFLSPGLVRDNSWS